MFKKKCVVKGSQSIRKSDVKSLKLSVIELIGEDNGDLLDLVVDKNDVVIKSKYCCGFDVSAFVYYVNKVPLFISVDQMPAKEQALIAHGGCHKYPVVPTVFFFLRLHQLLTDKKEQWTRLVNEAGAAVTCFGQTSRFLLNGAHLMMSGIVKTHTKVPVAAGDLALIYTNGLDIPYAVGYVTDNLVSQTKAGVGVYIVHCFRDSLWREHEDRFRMQFSLSSGAPLIPNEFGVNEVFDGTPKDPQTAVSVAPQNNVDAEADKGMVTMNEEGSAAAAVLFEDEDAVLTFCLCEAVKQMSCSVLPLPLTQFTCLVVQSFPRDGVHAAPIRFANTTYKHGLVFFKKFPDLLTIAETKPGVHAVVSVNKSAGVMREHMEKYKTFLETAHHKACEEEARAFKAKILEGGAAVVRQRVESACVFYSAPPDLDEDLVRVLILGDDLSTPKNVRFPTLEQVTNGAPPICEPTPVHESLFDTLLTSKTLTANLKKYIQAHRLLTTSSSDKGTPPNVKIDGILAKMLSFNGGTLEVSLIELKMAMLGLFRINHEIILQTVMEGSSTANENLFSKRILEFGALPCVSVQLRKQNNFFLTIVQNVEAFGFDVDLLALQWRKRFSVSCSVFNAAKKRVNLKSRTTVPLEIRLQGDFVSEVNAFLINEANLPPSVLVRKKS